MKGHDNKTSLSTMTYTLTERESLDPDYAYSETFDTIESARQRMHELYKDNTHMDVVVSAEMHDRSAVIVFNDGNELSYDIE